MEMIDTMEGRGIAQGLTSVEALKAALPKGVSAKVTQDMVDKIQGVGADGLLVDVIEEQMCSYMHLLGPRVGIDVLLNALKFCNLVLTPKMTKARAYSIVFPDKAKEIEDRGETVDSFASMYGGTKTVVAIQKLLVIPTYLTYQPYFHAAVQKQFDLMNGISANPNDKVSPTVQQMAAAKLADLTAIPEDNTIQLKVGLSDEAKDMNKGLMDQIRVFTDIQMRKFDAGEDISEVQKTGISVELIEASIVEE